MHDGARALPFVYRPLPLAPERPVLVDPAQRQVFKRLGCAQAQFVAARQEFVNQRQRLRGASCEVGAGVRVKGGHNPNQCLTDIAYQRRVRGR